MKSQFKKGQRVRVVGAADNKRDLIGKTGVVREFAFDENGDTDLYGVAGLQGRVKEAVLGIHAFTADQLQKV